MATHSSILAWRIPWTKEPIRLQCLGSQELDMTEQRNQHQKVNTTVSQLYFNQFCLKKRKKEGEGKEERGGRGEEGEGEEWEGGGGGLPDTEQNPPSLDFFPVRMCSLCECSRCFSLRPLRIWWIDIHIPLPLFQSLRKVVMFAEHLLHARHTQYLTLHSPPLKEECSVIILIWKMKTAERPSDLPESVTCLPVQQTLEPTREHISGIFLAFPLLLPLRTEFLVCLAPLKNRGWCPQRKKGSRYRIAGNGQGWDEHPGCQNDAQDGQKKELQPVLPGFRFSLPAECVGASPVTPLSFQWLI